MASIEIDGNIGRHGQYWAPIPPPPTWHLEQKRQLSLGAEAQCRQMCIWTLVDFFNSRIKRKAKTFLITLLYQRWETKDQERASYFKKCRRAAISLWKRKPLFYCPACSINLYYRPGTVDVSVCDPALTLLIPLPTHRRALSFSDHSPGALVISFLILGNPLFILTRLGDGGGEQETPAALIAGGSGRRRDLPKVTELESGGAQTLPQVSSSS